MAVASVAIAVSLTPGHPWTQGRHRRHRAPRGIQGPKGDIGDTGPAGPGASFYIRSVTANGSMAVARCDAGDQATGGGGGGAWPTGTPLMRGTRPVFSNDVPVGWLVEMQSPPGELVLPAITAYVVCADVTI